MKSLQYYKIEDGDSRGNSAKSLVVINLVFNQLKTMLNYLERRNAASLKVETYKIYGATPDYFHRVEALL